MAVEPSEQPPVVSVQWEVTWEEPEQYPEDCGYSCSSVDYYSDFQGQCSNMVSGFLKKNSTASQEEWERVTVPHTSPWMVNLGTGVGDRQGK